MCKSTENKGFKVVTKAFNYLKFVSIKNIYWFLYETFYCVKAWIFPDFKPFHLFVHILFAPR